MEMVHGRPDLADPFLSSWSICQYRVAVERDRQAQHAVPSLALGKSGLAPVMPAHVYHAGV